MKIFITGATGLVGRSLASRLEERGDAVIRLSRQAKPGFVTGDPARAGEWLKSIDDCDSVVHLAGENIFAKRWSESFKQRILSSRVDSTRLIAERMAKNPNRKDGTPKVLISASAVGYYGPQQDEELTESSPPGGDFMAQVCQAWESAADAARRAGVRVVHPRLGIVLDRHDGALPRLALPFKLFVGGRVGHGRQWVSWIHILDLVNLLIRLLDDSTIEGPVNAVAPQPVRNSELSAALSKVLRRPNWLPVPAFALRLVLGEVAEVVTAGQRVKPEKIGRTGFTFGFPTVETAFADLFAVSKSS